MSTPTAKDLPPPAPVTFDDRILAFERAAPDLRLASPFIFNGGRVIPTEPISVMRKKPIDWGRDIRPLVLGRRVTPDQFPVKSLIPEAGWNLSLVLFERPLLGSERDVFLAMLQGAGWRFGGLEQAAALSAFAPKARLEWVEVIGAESATKSPQAPDHGRYHLALRWREAALMLDTLPNTPVSGYGTRSPILLYSEVKPKK